MKQHVYATSPKSLSKEDLLTWANIVTVVRTVGGLVVFSIAVFKHSRGWNFTGLVLFWGLDILDGFLARTLKQETRLGAQMDILSDRLLLTFFYLNYLMAHPDLVVPITLFLFEFMGLDHYLSNQFMRWPILSPNYFYKVDRTLWRLNWSVPSKLLNSTMVTILLLVIESLWPVLLFLTGLISVKIYSCVRLHRLPPHGL
jgi:CDP-diacylglycerol--glycerol-3-phosphate 3-phosphatidyltransferase